MISLAEMNDIPGKVLVHCTDGDSLIGRVVSVDDYEESGLGEAGVAMFLDDGRYVEIGISEISSFEQYEVGK